MDSKSDPVVPVEKIEDYEDHKYVDLTDEVESDVDDYIYDNFEDIWYDPPDHQSVNEEDVPEEEPVFEDFDSADWESVPTEN
ncbi:hypothetical protein DMENIID0001_112330 [Sergentomyia squamirostris]